MNTICIYQSEELHNLYWEWIITKVINESPSSISRQSVFLHSIGYKSAKYLAETHNWELSDEDYTWFLLRWS